MLNELFTVSEFSSDNRPQFQTWDYSRVIYGQDVIIVNMQCAQHKYSGQMHSI